MSSRSSQTSPRTVSCGQVGTVVELLDGAYEVEFSDDEGKTYAELALEPDQLLVLHHRPQQAAGSFRRICKNLQVVGSRRLETASIGVDETADPDAPGPAAIG